jgi:hypothetical protein
MEKTNEANQLPKGARYLHSGRDISHAITYFCCVWLMLLYIDFTFVNVSRACELLKKKTLMM